MNELLKSILDGIYSVVNNYGLSIIFFTLLIKLCLLPLDYKSRKGMRKMSALAPKQAELQKKYGHDQEKLNRKLQELYRKEGASPMAGCWPLLLSMPILFAMYGALRYMANEQLVDQTFQFLLTNDTAIFNEPFLWVKNMWMPDSPFSGTFPTLQSLQMVEYKQWQNVFNALPAESVAKLSELLNIGELTVDSFNKGETLTATLDAIKPLLPVAQESSYLRLNLLITQLIVKEPFNGLFILPILSAVSQYTMTKLQEKQNPTPAPTANGQQQPNSGAFMKWFFPLFSLWICASSNAAFALYWVITNLFSLVSNQLINMKLNRDERLAAENPTIATGKGGLK